MKKKPRSGHLDTKLAHLGRAPAEHFGFVNTPIYRGSTVLFETMDDLLKKRGRYYYGRRGTPTSESLHTAWAELSGAAGAVSVPSGLAAITLALLACLKPGDHLLLTDSVYFPTRQLCDNFLKPFRIDTTYYNPGMGSEIYSLLKPATKAIYAESPGSLTFEVQDIPALAKVAHDHGALLLLDNTWATPLLFPPHKHGADIVIEAGTKYLTGHSDSLIGLVSANEKAWPLVHDTFQLFGICASPEDQFLALRGMRTMSLRLRHQEKTALNIANWLEPHPAVARVLHPALPSCPGHELWKRDFKGSSGVFAIELAETSQESIAHMLDGMELFSMGYSWGGYESLILPYDCSYRSAAPCGPRLRLQIGLEDERDLIADLEAGLQRLRD